ncbi:MAG: neocarzinostatin apoprotein domain-containing protein [Acidimicrobiales bacterium]
MNVVRRLRPVVAALAAGTTLVVGGALGTAVAGAKTTPHVVATPATGLKNGTTVKVTGSGFKPGDTVYVVQCVWNATGQAGCNYLSATPATVTTKGTLPVTKYKVTTGTVGNGKCGTKKSNLRNCEISVGNISGGDSAVTRITFVLPKG